jgi:hypothetical protein
VGYHKDRTKERNQMKFILLLALLAFGADKLDIQKQMDIDTFSIPKTENMTIVKRVELKITKTFKDTLVLVKTDTLKTVVLDTLIDVQKVSKKIKVIKSK